MGADRSAPAAHGRARRPDHPTLTPAVRVVALRDLAAGDVERWRAGYDRFGTTVQQSHAYARAVSDTGGRVLVALSGDVIAPFTEDATRCTALGGDVPLLGPDEPDPGRLVAVVTAVRRATGRSVYLPLVDRAYGEVAGHGGFTSWDRPPNSVIDWHDQGRDLWARVRDRGTSQLDRKRRLVERDGLALDLGRSGEEAARDVLAVDDRSWKAARGQSMRERGNQWDLYGRLVRAGVLRATFLRDGDRPVAFRLDGRANDRVTCLKWSFDEDYRRYSPGLYLLTEGLTRQWRDQGVRVVDLFGGPDSLKDLLHTHRVPRVDVWCGDTALGAELARDRHELDRRVARVRDGGKGLRHAFG